MYDPDSDVRWDLNFFDVDQIFSSTYYGDSSQHDVNISHEQYTEDSYYDGTHVDVENDEIIAHTLQEEFSKLSAAEAAYSLHGGEEHLQVDTGVQDWHCPPTGYQYSGSDGFTGETNDIEPSSSCFSPEDNSYDDEEDACDLEITYEYALDGEVGKRLNEMVPIPHVPRINGDIPSSDEATSDHQRLLDRLQYYGLDEHKVNGDGNCQFRALSDQLYCSAEHHKFVRQAIVNQLKSHPDMYEGYVPMEYDDYLKKMAKGGEWGDHVTLQAAADSYGVKILVITSFKDTCYIEILPKEQKSERVICLSFWAEVHYNSIYPQGELPRDDYKRKKKWWKFGNKHQNSVE